MPKESNPAEPQESCDIESGELLEATHAIAQKAEAPVALDSNREASDASIDVERREDSRPESKVRPRFPDFAPENETFPWQMLPETIRGAVIEICKNDNVAVPIAVQAVLSAVSLACQDLIFVDRGIAKNEKTVCSLYMLSVADSGSRKSRADTVVTSCIEAYDRKRRAEFAERKEIVDYDLKERLRKRRELEKVSGTLRRKSHTLAVSEKANADELAEKARRKLEDVEREIAELREQDFAYREPRLQRVLYSKIPIRQLEQNLAENWPSAGLFSDEAAGILNARGESDMSSLDKLWEGKAIDVVGRTARESFFIEDPRLTVSLMVQPIIFDRFLERKGELAKGIGFMSRVLLSRADTPYGKRTIDGSEPKQTDWIELFNEQILALLSRSHSDLAMRDQNRQTLYFTPSAQQYWDNVFNGMERATGDGGRFVHEREFVNRYSEHVARLAALFHFFENARFIGLGEQREDDPGELEIPEPTVKAADSVVAWYLNEFGRVFNPEVAMKEMAIYVMKQFRKLLEVKNGGPLLAPMNGDINCRIPFHELRTNCSRFDLKKTEKFRMVLDWLVVRGNIAVIESERRRKGMVERPSTLEPEMVAIKYEKGGFVDGVERYEFFFEIDKRPVPPLIVGPAPVIAVKVRPQRST